MRIGIDSSVLIAALISRAGVCAELLEDVLLGHQLVISEFILEELTRKLVEKFNYSTSDAVGNGAFLRRVGIVVQPTELPSNVCRDPSDVPVLGTAVAGRCSLLISVDRDLLDMGAIQGFRLFARANIGGVRTKSSEVGAIGARRAWGRCDCWRWR